MEKVIGVVAAFCLLASCAHPHAGAPGDRQIGTAIHQGTSYLRRALREDRYHLACRASDGSDCPVHEAGHVFAGFFMR
jgi:hypothetical protein